MAVKDYSASPELNVSISGINIAEGCPPSGINNAIRQLMADVKAESEALAVKATAEAQGPVLLSDSTSGTRRAESGVAASEYAVKLAYDRGTQGVDAAASASAAAGTAQSTADSAASAASAAQSTADSALSKANAASGRAAVLPGTVIAWAANSAPSGYLLCNGASVSRSTYAALFGVIGTTYGAGDGSSTFQLPNLTDRVIQGHGTAGAYRNAGLPNIWGDTGYNINRANSQFEPTGAFYVGSANARRPATEISNYANALQISASRCSSVYGASSTVQPAALTMRYYIKY